MCGYFSLVLESPRNKAKLKLPRTSRKKSVGRMLDTPYPGTIV